MENYFTERIAAIGLSAILSLIVIFHLLVIFRVIPFEIVWGGRLKDSSQMLLLETVSVTINLIMLVTVAIYSGFLKVKINRAVLKTILWIMVAFFFLNTVGNLFSNNEIEKIVFTPLTLLLSIFSFLLAISNEHKTPDRI